MSEMPKVDLSSIDDEQFLAAQRDYVELKARRKERAGKYRRLSNGSNGNENLTPTDLSL